MRTMRDPVKTMMDIERMQLKLGRLHKNYSGTDPDVTINAILSKIYYRKICSIEKMVERSEMEKVDLDFFMNYLIRTRTNFLNSLDYKSDNIYCYTVRYPFNTEVISYVKRPIEIRIERAYGLFTFKHVDEYKVEEFGTLTNPLIPEIQKTLLLDVISATKLALVTMC